MGRIPQSLAHVLGIAVVAVACSADAASLTRPPYVQSVDQDSAVVAFRTDTTCAGAVRYGTRGELTSMAQGGTAGTRHVVLLENLAPGTEYTYRVEACGTVMDRDRTFRTATGAGTQRVHFAAVGDQGTGGTRQKEVAARMLEKRPEFWVAAGDNAYDNGTEQEFQDRFFAPMPDLLAASPVFPSTGNHEYNTNQAQPYIDNFYLPSNNPAGTERYYSFDWGHVHVTVLDTYCHVASIDRCDNAAQLAWLKKDLAETKQPWKFIVMHHPPWSSGGHGSSLTTRSNFSAIFEQYGVDLVFTGHDHDYERTRPMRGNDVDDANGIPYLVVGSGGAGLRAWPSSTPPAWSAYRNNVDHGFMDVVVEGGTLTANWVTHAGAVKDTLVLKKSVPAPQYSARITAEPQSGGAPLQTLLVAQSDVPGASFKWTLGDGSSATGASVNHSYANPGVYAASVTATGAGGETATATLEIGVGAPNCEATQSCPSVDSGGSSGGGGATPDGDRSGCGGGEAAALVPAGLLGALWRRRRRR